jgi:hypothetical protein
VKGTTIEDLDPELAAIWLATVRDHDPGGLGGGDCGSGLFVQNLAQAARALGDNRLRRGIESAQIGTEIRPPPILAVCHRDV